MKRSYYLIALILLTFFVISFLTNIIGPLIPDIIESYSLNLTLAGLLPFAFFIAYGVMSIPSGMMVEAWGEKRVMMAAFGLAAVAALLFAVFPVYQVYVVSLFLIGAGMAMLQVAINPLLRVAGGEAHFAFNSVLGQLFFGAASFLSPLVYAYLVQRLGTPQAETDWLLRSLSALVPEGMSWISLYWLFAIVAGLMVLILAVSAFPKVERKEEEKTGALHTHLKLLKNPLVILYFLGIFAYVGMEQGVANWISAFLQHYHEVDPQSLGAKTVSRFWGLMTAGAVLGLVMLKLLDSRKVLAGFTLAAMICLAMALFGSRTVALWCFPLVGFFASVMWSIIISLALNSVREHHGSFSGILVTGIAGGAVMPLVVGALGDWLGLRLGMLFLYLCLGYILSMAFWARPLVNNATLGARQREKEQV
ncbi:MAG: MFS transporter [Bacteroidetes bacterium]|nr:MAG: MFS transporter [Bacteroidota bacterium]